MRKVLLLLVIGMVVLCKEVEAEDLQLGQVRQVRVDHSYKYSRSYGQQREAYFMEMAEFGGMVVVAALLTFLICKGIVAGMRANERRQLSFADQLLSEIVEEETPNKLSAFQPHFQESDGQPQK